MPNVTPTTSIGPAPRSSAMAGEVADDMAAIFGDGQRGSNTTSRRDYRRVEAQQGKRPRSLPTIALLTVGALAAMIGTGVVVGKHTIGPADVGTPPRSATVAARPAPMPSPRIESATVAPMALPPEAMPGAMPDAIVASAAPIDVPATAPGAVDRPVQANTVPAPPRPGLRDARGDSARPAPSFLRTPRVAREQPAGPPAAIAAGSRADCYGYIDCTNVRLYAADGDVARAYAEATSSGVRARDLRDYRSEWIRARNVAADRPREALRIYEMVAADLRTLADDAIADDRTPWQ